MELDATIQPETTENVQVEQVTEQPTIETPKVDEPVIEQPKISEESATVQQDIVDVEPIKIKQKSLNDFTEKVRSNSNYSIFQAKKDFPDLNIDRQKFTELSKYANTKISNKLTVEALNKKFTASTGFEIDDTEPLGKQVPGEAIVGQSGVTPSPSGETKPTETITPEVPVVDETITGKITGGGSAQVQAELAEKRKYKQIDEIPEGFSVKNGLLVPDEATRKQFQIYEGSAINYKKAKEGINKQYESVPGAGMVPRIPTEQDRSYLNNTEKQAQSSIKAISEPNKLPTIAKFVTDKDRYFQFLNFQKNDKGEIKSFTINKYKINEVANEYATAYGLPRNGYFSKLLENQISSAAEYKYKEAKAEPYFEKFELPKLKKKYPEMFSQTEMLNQFLESSKKDDELFQGEKLKIKQIKSDLEVQQDAELEPIAKVYKESAQNIIGALENSRSQYTASIEALQQKVNSGYDIRLAEQEQAILKQKQDQDEVVAETELKGLWEKYLDSSNRISTKYNNRLDRHIQESQAYIEAQLETELKDFVKNKNANPKFLADFKKARLSSFTATGAEVGLQQALIESTYRSSDALEQSFNKMLGSSLESYGETFGADWIRVYGQNLAANTIISPANVKNWSDMLSIYNVAKLTGQLGGVMLPSIGAGVAVSYMTGGLGLPSVAQGIASLTAGSTASWLVNTTDMANRMYLDEFNKNGNVAAALDKSQKMFDFELGEFHLHVADNLPFGNYLKPFINNPFLRAAVLGAVSYTTETIQEERETIAEEAIRDNLDPYAQIAKVYQDTKNVIKNKLGSYDFLSDAEKKNAYKSYRLVKSTMIATSPMLFGGAASGFASAKTDAYKRSEASNEGMRLYQEFLINEKSDYKALRQQLGTIAMERGADYAIMVANSMYQKAQIQTKGQFERVVNSIKAADELIKSPSVQKMKRDDRSIYLSLADSYQRSVVELETETDPNQKAAIEKRLTGLKSEMESFAASKKTNMLQLTLSDGTAYFFLPEELVTALDDNPDLVNFITNGLATVSAAKGEFNEQQKAAFEVVKQKINEFEAALAPVVPGSVQADTEITAEQKANIQKAAVPTFASYQDALYYINERAKQYGSLQNFYASDEYAELYPELESIYKTEQEVRTAETPEDSLKIVESKGYKVGDKVSLETQNREGVPVTLTGTVAVLNGVPVINLDNNQSTMSGDVVVRINDNWKKTTEDAVQEQAAGKVPVQSEAGVSETMAQGKPQAEPQVTTTEVQAEVTAEGEVQAEEVLGEISDKEYNDFIDKGIVSSERLNDIAKKVKNKENLSEREQAIFADKTADINNIIANQAEGQPKTKAEPEAEGKAKKKPLTEEQKQSNAKQTRIDNLKKALRRKMGMPSTNAAPINVNINNIDALIKMSEKSGTEVVTKILKDAKKIILATGKNNTAVVIHLNQSSYKNSILNAGGSAMQSLSNGFFLDKDGNIMHINVPAIQLTKANETVFHEGAHPLLEYLAETDPKAIENFYSQLESLLPIVPDVQKALDFGKGYANPIQAKKEAIVQFLALVANGDIRIDELPQTTIDKIKNWIKNFLSALGITFEMEINTTDDIYTVAQKFSFALDNARQVIKDNKEKLSPQNNLQLSSVNPDFATRDGNKIGFIYDNDLVARERFNIDGLERISAGSDRVVFDLGNGMVLKIAKTPRGLAQNIYEGDYYLVENGVIPDIYERGLNYNVVQKVDPATGNKQINEMLKEFQKFTQKDFDNKTGKIQDVLNKYGFEDVLSYDLIWNDFTRKANWGVASDGRPIHLDGGTFGGIRMLDEYKGVKAMSDQDFRDVYTKSKEAKEKFGETKSKYPQFSMITNESLINGFYSPLERTINEAKQDKMPAKQWRDKFATTEEAKWTGLQNWLSQQDGSLTKQDILNYLKDNRITVDEVVKQNFGDLWRSAYKERNQKFLQEVKDLQEYGISIYHVEGRADFPDSIYKKLPKGIKDKLAELMVESDFLNAVRKNEGNAREVIVSGSKVSKFSQYQLEGEKENYKEVLVTLPTKRPIKEFKWTKIDDGNWIDEESNIEIIKTNDGEFIAIIVSADENGDPVETILGQYTTLDDAKKGAEDKYYSKKVGFVKGEFKSTHFDEPNILVHLRMNIRTDADGNKVLFLEEVQSDWGQKGKKEGFGLTKEGKRYFELKNREADLENKYNKKYGKDWIDKITKEESDEYYKYIAEMIDLSSSQYDTRTPEAPFVMDTNAWTKLGLKFALKEAVAQGADKIAWTTGEQQNERYDLSKQVDGIKYRRFKKEDSTKGMRLGEDLYSILMLKDEGMGIDLETGVPIMDEIRSEKDIPESKLESYVGKELAEKIINSKDVEKTFTGVDLKIGGKGMKGFYGSIQEGTKGIVGGVAEKLFGQKVGETKIEDNTQPSIDVTPELQAQVQKGLPQFSMATDAEGKLIEFIEDQRNQGQSDEDIREALISEGYGETAIEKAFEGISMAPSGIKPSKLRGKKEGKKLSSVWERIANTYEEEGNADAAEYIRTHGRYGTRNQASVYAIAKKILFDENNGSIEITLKQIKEEGYPDDLVVAVYGAAIADEVAKPPSLKRSKNISDLMKGLSKVGTNYGQAVSMFQYVYQQLPELFYESKEAEHVASIIKNLGDPQSPGTKANNIKKNAVPKIKAVRRDTLSAISAALGGLIPIESLFDPKNKYYLSDNKMLDTLKVLLDYGQRLDDAERTMLQNMVAKMVEGDWAETEIQARKIIRANLNDLNGKLRTPFTEQEINTLTSEMIGAFLNIAYKGVRTKDQTAFKSKKDIFNQIANVIAQKSDAVILLGNNKDGQPSLTGRMKKGLSILLGKTAEDKTVLSEMMKRLLDGGFVEEANTKAEAEQFVRQALEERNSDLQTPLITRELDDMAAAFVDLYEELASQRIKDALDTILSPKKTTTAKIKTDKVVQAVLYGALEDEDAFNKFAQMFGVTTITPEMKEELTNLSVQVQQAKSQGALAYNQALYQFNRAFYNAQLQGKVGLAKALGVIGQGGWFIEGMLYNNILASINSMLRAGTGNVQKVAREYGYAILRGEMDLIKKAWNESTNRRDFNVEVFNQNGQLVKIVPVDLRLVTDNIYSSLRGLPRLSEVKRSGLNETELKIRFMKSGFKKNAARFLTVPASRLLSTIDSATTPFAELLTKRQLYLAVLKQAYQEAGVYASRIDLMDMIDELLEPNDTEVQNAIVQARKDIINGPLYKQLGMTSFPDADPRFTTGKLSKESKIYNEFIQRIYEILDESSVQRAANVAANYGWNNLFDVADVVKQVDDLSSKTASEITYLGQPRGMFGGWAQSLANISNNNPLLKYFGFVPMFTNASMNAASYCVKLTPIINGLQYASYQIKGQRGLTKNMKALYDRSYRQQDYSNNAILSFDQKKMRDNVIFTNTLFVASIALLTGDDEEKRRKWKEGKGTGLTPLVLNDAQKKLGLKPGFLYINGTAVAEYKDSAFQPFWAAVAFASNSIIDDVFTTDPFSRQPFQTETRTREDEDFLEAISNYTLFTMLTAADNSTLKSMSETLNDVMKIISQPEEVGTGEVLRDRGKEVGKLFAKKAAGFASMFIPYKRLGGEAKSIVGAMMGENKKKSLDFTDQIFKNTMLERWILQSDETDYFGRPVKETFKFVNPLFFLVQIGDEFSGDNYERPEDYGYGDKYLMLFGRQNYSPMSSIGDVVPFTYRPKDFANSFYFDNPKSPRQMSDAEINQMDNEINTASTLEVDYKTFIEQQDKRLQNKDPRIQGIYDIETQDIFLNEAGTLDGGKIINYQLTAEEAYMINRKKGEFVYDIISYEVDNVAGETLSNFDKLKNLDSQVFRSLMDKLYQLGRNVAIRNNLPDFTSTNQEQLDKRIFNSYKAIQDEFLKYDMVWPDSHSWEFLIPNTEAKIDGTVTKGEFKFK